MKRLLMLLIFLVKTSVMQAQSAGPLYALNQPERPTPTAVAPAKPKAIESPFYIKAYGYYSLLTPGTDINYDVTQAQSSLPNSFKANKTRGGAGPRAGLGIGLIVSDFINVGIDADMLFGTPVKSSFDVFTGSSSAGFSHFTVASTTTLTVLSIIPNITFKALSRPTYYIYNRLGFVGGYVLDFKMVNQTVETPAKGAVTTGENTYNYTKNSLAIGYQAALGIQFRLSQAIRAFAEVVAYNQSFKPQENKITASSTTNGKTTTSSSTLFYKDQGDRDNANANETPSVNVAINSVGVGAGLLVRF